VADTLAENEQTRLWRGSFGDEYISRNPASAEAVRASAGLWARVLRRLQAAPPRTILEVGSNVGINLVALRALTDAELFALEPNGQARKELLAQGVVAAKNALEGVASRIGLPDSAIDLVFTRGVLIHIHPDELLSSCREIHRVARRYVVSMEYFSANPEQLAYRGESNALFKRDFGAFWLDHFPDLRALDYGFAWKRLTGLDNLTWWLFEKRG
jgi:spore coat polysaccharide biosynthesis protein SpsF